MNLLFVAPRLHPNYTDALSALSARHSVTVVVSHQARNERYGKLAVATFEECLLSRTLSAWHKRGGMAPDQFSYRMRHPSLRWFINLIRTQHIDTIYARRDNRHLYRTARLASLIAGVTFVDYRQETLDPSQPHDRRSVYPLVAKRTGQFSSPNFIPLSIDATRTDNLAPGIIYQPDGSEPLRIMAVGKLIERKGHQLLIEAVARLRNRMALQVDLYGAFSAFHDSQYGSQIASLIHQLGVGDFVRVMPTFEPENMLAEYRKHHLFAYTGWVSPSQQPKAATYDRADGRSGTRLYSLLEAMCAGLPVLCASEPAVLGAVEDGGNGLIFEKRNAADLAEKIITISKQDLTAMGAKSRALVLECYNAQDFPPRFENFLRAEK